MGILLTAVGVFVPGFVRKKKLAKLFSITADAFGIPMPSLEKLTVRDCLRTYALFTKKQSGEALSAGREDEVKEKLYHNALLLGTALRREFGVRNFTDAMKLARLVYSIVGIDFRGEASGGVTVERCFFSRFYSPSVCGIMSSLDAGLLAGISGGGRLDFYRRITAGAECCRAGISFVANPV